MQLPSSNIPLKIKKLRPQHFATTPPQLRNFQQLLQSLEKLSATFLPHQYFLLEHHVAAFNALFTIRQNTPLLEAAILLSTTTIPSY